MPDLNMHVLKKLSKHFYFNFFLYICGILLILFIDFQSLSIEW